MSDRFQDRYRIPSARASWWDYGRNAAYFVTICLDGRECYFGDVIETKIILSPIGEIAQSYWSEIPQHFPYVQLDSFVVMPNHVHGIIIIDKRIGMIVENESFESKDNNPFNSMTNSTNAIFENSTDAPVETRMVETRLIASLQPDPTIQKQKSINKTRPQKLFGGITGENNPMLYDNLSRIVRWYKGRTTFESHKINPNFAWQARFYETIIRNEQSYRIKSEYIISNRELLKNLLLPATGRIMFVKSISPGI